jgi:NADH:ubiquinone oxidoreductase subunit 5 (subunit L)/multisubunit Na+/H+ antiporter MnhA subunit
MNAIPTLLLIATLLPLASFWVILFAGTRLGRSAATISIGAILGSAALSFLCLFIWLGNHWPQGAHHDDPAAHADAGPLLDVRPVALKADDAHAGETHDGHADGAHAPDHAPGAGHGHAGHGHAHHEPPPVYTGVFYTLANFGNLRVEFSYYIDTLTIAMFCMVTLIASCIHFYASGYMHDELHDVHDHEVRLSNGRDLLRPGRYFRFFQYLSLFCFSMLGLVLAGNIFLVFVFWELVGICSYFLIGFYVERKSASTAANKAFIVNRVGDFGMIIGLMAFWSSLGTFSFGDLPRADGTVERGLFSSLRSEANDYQLVVPDEMIAAGATREISAAVSENPAAHYSDEVFQQVRQETVDELREGARNRTGPNYGYWLLVVGGIGIFCGCIGKSAQFPLHVWLPDAMEGPTPVSALVHSATMVAAGVYLTGRFYPMFAPEVLLVIATVGTITLFMAATIAVTATDIKRVLAYSTISQLGYMMLSLGVGGWLAGLMHLITHAFFKSLLFLCSGSVIHAVHTNDMRLMGGLLKKMPVTAITMLIGCLAIAGVGVPFVVGFSGYYSKDMILEQAYSLMLRNNSGAAALFFVAAAGGAAITAFYMFRMWYMTFVGTPRDVERYDHAHESPPVMYWPLIILSVFAIAVAWDLRMIGYAIIPAVLLLFKGSQEGWFKPSPHGHGHDDHGHGDHGHDAHGHDAHGHDVHSPAELPAHASATHVASASPDHSHVAVTHGHTPADHHREAHPPAHAHVGHDDSVDPYPARTGVTWGWVLMVVLLSLVGGWVIQATISALPGLGNARAFDLTLGNMLEQARPAGTAADVQGFWIGWTWPDEHFAHRTDQYGRIVVPVTLLATGTWVFGIGLATLMYGLGYLSPEEVRRQFQPVYRFLWNKWYFDELYNALFVQPAHVASRFVAGVDRNWIDGLLHLLARFTVSFARAWEWFADRVVVDGFVNIFAGWLYSLGVQLRVIQTGRLRQYVVFIVIGALAIFVLVSFFWDAAAAR